MAFEPLAIREECAQGGLEFSTLWRHSELNVSSSFPHGFHTGQYDRHSARGLYDDRDPLAIDHLCRLCDQVATSRTRVDGLRRPQLLRKDQPGTDPVDRDDLFAPSDLRGHDRPQPYTTQPRNHDDIVTLYVGGVQHRPPFPP